MADLKELETIMAEETVTIEVDGKTLKAPKGAMIIEVTDQAGITVPRFCYHKKLSVAANCRMCLVEVERAPKPVPACATPVMDGMKVSTRSALAMDAQKSTMEFLLINHPLDCPICDQGGECELQDMALDYGSDVSRYSEQKRVVKDKNIGPLIQTDMTRCIHCTRCVRFGDEVAGLRELGATGRGENMQIGTYIEKAVTSELSGNVIDLCPVGALTSKPYRYSARAWELRQHDTIAPHDAVGSNLHLHVKGNIVKRVVPKENEAINETWISDRDRFSYEGLNSPDRLTTPMIKQNGEWRETDWETALNFAVDGLKKADPARIGAMASANSTLEELYLFQKLVRGMGCPNIDHRFMQADFTDQDKLPIFPWLGQSLVDLESLDAGLLIGSNLRHELPLVNHRIRKAVEFGGQMFVVNPVNYDFNWQPVGSLIQSPSATESIMAGIAKALLDDHSGAAISLAQEAVDLLKNIEPTREQKIIAEGLVAGENSCVMLGHIASAYPNAAKLRGLAGLIAELSKSKLCYLPESANSVGAWLAGVLPHRLPGGNAIENTGANTREMFVDGMDAYILLGTEPEYDCLTSIAAVQSMNTADFVVSVFGFKSNKMMEYADVLLPMGLFAETSGTYVNAEGSWQSFSGAVKPQGQARPAWKILRVLGNKCDQQGFDYDSSVEVLEEVRSQVGDLQPDNSRHWILPEEITSELHGIELVLETPMYFTDPLVRRAPALQASQRTDESVLHVHPKQAAKLGVKEGDRIRLVQDQHSVELRTAVNARLPETCALWRRGLKPEPDFGIRPGQFTLEKVS